MSTITPPVLSHRALTHRAGAESLVAALLAAVALLVLVAWLFTGTAGVMVNLDETRVPSPHPQVAPRPGP